MTYNASQYNNESQHGVDNAVELVFTNAIDQISRITGLNKQQTLSFVQQRYNLSKKVNQTNQLDQIINGDESQYIGSLFS
jgi:hypothetical protein